MSRPLSSLSPMIEHRLAGWEQIQYRLAHAPEPRTRPTITLSRQFGCEGFPLAERLKDLFEKASGEPWNIYDKTLIEKVALDEGLSLQLLQNLGDNTHALEALGLHSSTYVSHDQAFAKIAKAILQIAAVGNAVIVGRGGSVVCQSLKNCYHFRLEAGFEWRVQSIMTRLELGRKEAEKLVTSNMKLREKFINQCVGTDLAELKHYSAIFNNERCTPAQMGLTILACVKAGWPEPGYFQA